MGNSFENSPADMICNFTTIRFASRHMTRYFNSCIAPIGLRSNQFGLLRIVGRNPNISINRLAALTVMDRTAVGRSIQPLVRDGFLTISVDTADKRFRLLKLKKTGIEAIEKGNQIWVEAQRVFEAKFGATEAKAMRAAMGQVIATELA